MKFAYALLVNIPEEILLLFITLLVVNMSKYLNLKVRENITKMVYAVGITALFSIALHDFIQQYSFMMFVRILFFASTYCVVYKINFFKILLGFILSLIIFIFGEYIGTKTIELLMGIDIVMLESEYGGTYTYFALLIPRRIVQIAVIALLYKIRSIKKSNSKSIEK